MTYPDPRWNDTATPYQRQATIPQLIRTAAARAPDAPAIGDASGTRLTHGQLDTWSDRLANLLTEIGVGRGTYVALLSDRDAWAVAALVAIMKTGAAYVPVDPGWPRARIESLLGDLDVACIISGAAQQPEARRLAATLGSVPVCWTGADIAGRPARPPEVAVTSDDVAYAIFTSGSADRPEAVAVSHRPVVNLIEWLQREYAVGAADRLLFVTSFCSDQSVFDMFGVLASGGYLRVADASELSEPDVLIDLLLSERITIWDSAPAALELVTLFLGIRDDLAGAALRLVLLSGDGIPRTLPGEMRSAFPGADIVALGGATECTIWSSHHLANEVDPTWPSLPYGKPIANARYYVLDESGAQCRVGVAGDLYIGGECLALGYLNAPKLTASKFVRDPFSAIPGARMYRTGDRARWWEPGILEFLVVAERFADPAGTHRPKAESHMSCSV
jgi:amino acid adenylation domain-containing protein